MAALLPLSVLLRITQSALLAFKRPAIAHLTESVLQSLVLIAGAVAVGMYARSAATSVTMLGLHLLAFTASLAAGIYLLGRRVIPPQVATAAAEYDTRHWMTVAFPLFVISSMYVLMSYTDTVMLGMLADTTVSGIYAATSRIALLVSLPLVFINSVLIPYIASLYHGDRFTDLQYIVTMASRTAGLLALPVFIILGVSGDVVLGLFGEEFTSGKTALNILIAGQLVNVLSGSVGALLMMTGQHHFAAKVVTLCAMLNILLNYLLIPEFGINGAAAATAITVIIWNAVFVASTRRRIGIKPTIFAGLNK
jgi:O-antigen/teichoic acid export membrane protein